jgi:protein FAM32A
MCRTEAQIKHEAHLARKEAERLAKTASKSHRQRVQEYNEKLAQLTEHHDIPKVGPG